MTELPEASPIDSSIEATRGEPAPFPRELTFEIADTLFASELHMMDVFGRENVADGEIHVGEGETLPATVLWPKDPERRLKVAWHDNLNAASPERIVIGDSPSRWSIAPGFSTGTTLDSLERLNGGPFELLGFEWDYSGTVVNWNGGAVGDAESETRWLVVRLQPNQKDRERVGAEVMNRVVGDAMFSSDNPAMQEVNPSVYEVIMIFAGNGEGLRE